MSIFKRSSVAAFLIGAALAAGAGAFADGQLAMPGHGAHGDMSAHIDHALKHLYVDIDATPAQQAKIGPLVHQALQDLKPLHEQLHAAHQQAMQLMTAPTIDRAALEQSRQHGMQLADQASKRLVQLLADVGDVLTPVQRQKLAEHLAKLHGMGGMHAMHG